MLAPRRRGHGLRLQLLTRCGLGVWRARPLRRFGGRRLPGLAACNTLALGPMFCNLPDIVPIRARGKLLGPWKVVWTLTHFSSYFLYISSYFL